jgi:hypothetical protein
MTTTIVLGIVLLAPLLCPLSASETSPEGTVIPAIDWIEGYVSARGEGTATPSQNRAKDQMRAIRAATLLAQRAAFEIIKGVKIDSQTKVCDKMLLDDVINTRIEGTIRGGEIVKQTVRWEGDRPIATVELRVCLGGLGGCKAEKSLVGALNLDQKSEQSNAASQRLNDTGARHETAPPEAQDVVYRPGRPVTGVIFNLRGLFFERVILPVVMAVGDKDKHFTVYSVKSVEPRVIRAYGVVRYADSVEQAKQNPYLGDNVIIVPVSVVSKENIIMIGFDAARIIRETTGGGNDYLKSAKVVIAAK